MLGPTSTLSLGVIAEVGGGMLLPLVLVFGIDMIASDEDVYGVEASPKIENGDCGLRRTTAVPVLCRRGLVRLPCVC